MVRIAVIGIFVVLLLFGVSQIPKLPWRWPPVGGGYGPSGSGSKVTVPGDTAKPQEPTPAPEPAPKVDGRLEILITGQGYEVDGESITLTELKGILDKTRDSANEDAKAVRVIYTKDSRMFPREELEQLIKQSGLECAMEQSY